VATIYKIHPAIGIARLGNHDDKFTIGPEVPGGPSLELVGGREKAVSDYKADQLIKRQGARFRIYEYSDDSGSMHPVREITSETAGVTKITWTVHLANRKAAASMIFAKGDRNQGVPKDKLVIDAGAQSIAGANAGPLRLSGTFQAKHIGPVPVPLGDLRSDAAGRLIVLGGFGKSFSPTGRSLQNTFNNDDWCDDTSDGSVTATIRFKKKSVAVEVPAWVIVGPPDFAPPIGNIISLYEVAYDVAHAKFGVHYDPELAGGKISFARHIYPILRRTVDLYWVDLSLEGGHAPGAGGFFLDPTQFALLSSNNPDPASPARKRREAVLRKVRKPDGTGGAMPKLNAEFDTGRRPRLTAVQYDILQHWASGQFEADWSGDPATLPAAPPLANRNVTDQPFALDKAALDACVGASFYPGIEAPRNMREDPDLYEDVLRIQRHLPAGTITQGLAVPWQTDFGACGEGWWPAQRPNDIMRHGERKDWDESIHDWVSDWSKLGFVKATGGDPPFAEDERNV
jgi:hypothetical protein